MTRVLARKMRQGAEGRRETKEQHLWVVSVDKGWSGTYITTYCLDTEALTSRVPGFMAVWAIFYALYGDQTLVRQNPKGIATVHFVVGRCYETSPRRFLTIDHAS